jgi:NAD-dependent SIR2 family protein deacetylase
MKVHGQVIKVACKRCGVKMLKWERIPTELDILHPYPSDRICGRCLTDEDVAFSREIEGIIVRKKRRNNEK